MSTLRPFETRDLENVVRIHLESFRGFFLADLGKYFLREFYRSMLLDPWCIAFVEELNGRVAGFVVGTRRPAHLYGRLLSKSGLRLLPAALASVLRSPGVSVRLLRRLFEVQSAPYDQSDALLMSIAVRPSMQGRGIGRLLIAAFAAAARKQGALSVSLTTDALKNAAVNRFYVQFGFQRRRTFTTIEGREMNEYLLAVA